MPPIAKPCWTCLSERMREIVVGGIHLGKKCGTERYENDMQHCVASCRALKLCGDECAQLVDIREVLQRIRACCLLSPEKEQEIGDARRDNENNIIGRCLARCFPKKQCREMCADWLFIESKRREVLDKCMRGECP